jgi:hypothetical protein
MPKIKITKQKGVFLNMKNILRRMSAIIFCTVLCGITAFANPLIEAPFNPFEPADEIQATPERVQPTTEAALITTEPEPMTEAVIPTTTAAPPPVVPSLIPVRVRENNEYGVKTIVKTYELSGNENPEHISKDSFELNGWEYIFTDLRKRETVDTTTKEHTLTIELLPDTDDVQAVTAVLDKNMEYTSNDGYSGTLNLVESSVTAKVSGTKTVSFTLTETKKYDNLASNDSWHIPKSISDKYGRTLTLSSLEWLGSSFAYIDGVSFADNYTATATYIGTGYRKVATGYTGSAEYTGIISKSVPGKTIYTAVFTGTEIPPPTTEPPAEPTTEEIIEEPEPFNPVPAAVAGSAGGAGLLGFLLFFFLKMKNVKVCNFQGESYVQTGKARVGYKVPSIDLTPFANSAQSTNYALIIGRFAAWRLSDKSVKIIYSDRSLEHTVNSNGFKEYQFDVRF